MCLLLDICYRCSAILNGMAAADVKVMLLGGVLYNAMARAILPVKLPLHCMPLPDEFVRTLYACTPLPVRFAAW